MGNFDHSSTSQNSPKLTRAVRNWLESLQKADQRFYNLMMLEVWSIAQTMDELNPGFWTAYMRNSQEAIQREIEAQQADEQQTSSKLTRARPHARKVFPTLGTDQPNTLDEERVSYFSAELEQDLPQLRWASLDANIYQSESPHLAPQAKVLNDLGAKTTPSLVGPALAVPVSQRSQPFPPDSETPTIIQAPTDPVESVHGLDPIDHPKIEKNLAEVNSNVIAEIPHQKQIDANLRQPPELSEDSEFFQISRGLDANIYVNQQSISNTALPPAPPLNLLPLPYLLVQPVLQELPLATNPDPATQALLKRWGHYQPRLVVLACWLTHRFLIPTTLGNHSLYVRQRADVLTLMPGQSVVCQLGFQLSGIASPVQVQLVKSLRRCSGLMATWVESTHSQPLNLKTTEAGVHLVHQGNQPCALRAGKAFCQIQFYCFGSLPASNELTLRSRG